MIVRHGLVGQPVLYIQTGAGAPEHDITHTETEYLRSAMGRDLIWINMAPKDAGCLPGRVQPD